MDIPEAAPTDSSTDPLGDLRAMIAVYTALVPGEDPVRTKRKTRSKYQHNLYTYHWYRELEDRLIEALYREDDEVRINKILLSMKLNF